jgi:hypothetical protein
MKDPLNNFAWPLLHDMYDDKCRGFDKNSIHLAAFETDRPASDRALYYELLNVFSEKQRTLTTKPIEIYEALLYWKLYSQPAAISNTVLRLREDAALRKDTQERLLLLFQKFPAKLEKSTSAVLDIVKQLGSFQILGIKTSTALPVRTTLLHFMYPSVVPIFDKMVLQAIGVWDKHANQSTKVLMEYLPFAWELADRYAQNCSSFEKESPIRVIDMALWVGRGKESMSNRPAQGRAGKVSGTDKNHQEGHNSPNKKEASFVLLSGSMPRKGDVFQGRIYDLSQWQEGWKRRDIRYFKHELNRKESFAYPLPGNQITLIDTDGDRYELKFSKPDSEEKICLGTPSRLKPWYEKKRFDAQTVNPNDRIYFKYTGIGIEFYILTEQEYASSFAQQK